MAKRLAKTSGDKKYKQLALAQSVLSGSGSAKPRSVVLLIREDRSAGDVADGENRSSRT